MFPNIFVLFNEGNTRNRAATEIMTSTTLLFHIRLQHRQE